MRRGRRIRLRPIGGVVAAVLVAALCATTAEAGIQDDAAPRLVEGDWEGALDYSGDASTGQVSGVAGGTGSLAITVSGGRVTGSFSFLGSTSSVGPGGVTSQLTFGTDGSLDGDADAPVLVPGTATFTGEATAGGATFPIEFSGPLDPIPLTVTASDCNEVSGTFAQEAQAAVNAQGVAATYTGYFSVVRSKDAPPATADTLNGILNQLDALLALAPAGGAAPYSALAEVLETAEDFYASLPASAECGLPHTAAFMLAISGKVSALLEQVLAAPGAFTTDQLVELMYAGVQSGAIGAGAVDPATSEQLLTTLETELAARLQLAVTEGDEPEIEAIKIAAITFGLDDLVDQASGQ